MTYHRTVTAGLVLAATLATATAAHAQSSVGATVDVAADAELRSVTVTPSAIALDACLPLDFDHWYRHFLAFGSTKVPLPNGYCITRGTGAGSVNAPITVTNGPTAAKIEVQATDAAAVGGVPWTLCRGPGPGANACPGESPGTDQFTLLVQKRRCFVGASHDPRAAASPGQCFPGGPANPDDGGEIGLYSPETATASGTRPSYVGTTATCDSTFGVAPYDDAAQAQSAVASPSCGAAPGQSSGVFLTIQGPSSSTTKAPHTTTVTWSALPLG